MDMRLFELALEAEPRAEPRITLLALSLRLSDSDEAVVVLARFNRNLRIRKMSDILCCGDLRGPPPPPPPPMPHMLEVVELLEAPDAVVRSLVLPTSRVPMKQCVSAMISFGFLNWRLFHDSSTILSLLLNSAINSSAFSSLTFIMSS